MTGKQLEAIFGGTWDGADREIHGIVEREGRPLKIELLRGTQWVCSVFDRGACTASERDSDPQVAVQRALDASAD